MNKKKETKNPINLNATKKQYFTEKIKTKNKNKYKLTLKEQYLKNSENLFDGKIIYFSYNCINNKRNKYIKDLVFSENIGNFGKMINKYFDIRARIKQHSKKTIRKDSKRFKIISIKMILRFFRNQPITTKEIILILNKYFDFKINGFRQQQEIQNRIKDILGFENLNFFENKKMTNKNKMDFLRQSIKYQNHKKEISITERKIKSITNTTTSFSVKEKNKISYTNNLESDLREFQNIRKFNNRKVIQQYKANINKIKTATATENRKKEIQKIQKRINQIQKQKYKINKKNILDIPINKNISMGFALKKTYRSKTAGFIY